MDRGVRGLRDGPGRGRRARREDENKLKEREVRKNGRK